MYTTLTILAVLALVILYMCIRQWAVEQDAEDRRKERIAKLNS